MTHSNDLKLASHAIRLATGSRPRSPFYDWLFLKHDEIAARGGKRIQWEPICSFAAKQGIHDGSGKPPSVRRASKLWIEVQRAKALEHASVGRPGDALPQGRTADPPSVSHAVQATEKNLDQVASQRIPLAPKPPTIPAATPPQQEQATADTAADMHPALKTVLEQMEARYRRKHGFYGA